MKITCNKILPDPNLTLQFTVVGEEEELTEPPIIVNGLALVRFKFRYAVSESGNYTLLSNILLKKQEKAKSSAVKLNVTCEKVEKEWICTDDWIEHELVSKERDYFDNGIASCSLEVTINMQENRPLVLMQSKLYEDTEFTDFQLQVADGAVAVHKCVMAIHSDVFKKMMTGEWKETAKGCINLAGLSMRGLQHLKDYMYMGTLPDDDDGLKMLLLVADCYMIEHLKADCIRKLVETVTSANMDKLIEFACQNNMPALVRALVSQCQHRSQNGFYQLEAENKQENEKESN